MATPVTRPSVCGIKPTSVVGQSSIASWLKGLSLYRAFQMLAGSRPQDVPPRRQLKETAIEAGLRHSSTAMVAGISFPFPPRKMIRPSS
jgi:hypothetical protein